MEETKCVIVCTMLPMTVEANEFAKILINERLTACVQIFDPVTSIYRWKGKLVESIERPLQLKTASHRIHALIARIQSLHPYEVPELLILSVEGASRDYDAWIDVFFTHSSWFMGAVSSVVRLYMAL